ncbi:glutaminyl-peptide cyclotransferase [Panacibacter ginsenosidivorans]|uniref:Glutaminyl-peptide cyclotransferase n=1 Tax=Panacibacter ginsenosidivorans TaxID=1813871 RepID=A0A5B8V7E1_9BACT|nr:glutaminyl-peptide cyclotransferase [Panacibacter ginsenosidivorans]QEC67242.1 glutaminyl-peptide cyclotransferase [Panacibacter ginsenosidivorans]
MRKFLFAVIVLYTLQACNGSDGPADSGTEDNANPSPPLISYNIVRVYPHDTSSYTEGLIWQNNALYESAGSYNESRLFRTNLETAKADKSVKLANEYFGEGIAILNNKIYQLTYKEDKVFVYDLNTFQKIKELQWPHEGWGMTTNGKELIISTGSSNIYYVNPENFKIIRMIGVTDNYGPVSNINELEYVNGILYANKYLTNDILKIDPESGKVLGRMDLSGLLAKSGYKYDPAMYEGNTDNVLNGIAYDSAKNSFYVTGKKWPALFEIKLN